MGWAGALEAPSHGRFDMVPFVYVRVELMAARRAMRRPKQPREGRRAAFEESATNSISAISALKKIGINKLLLVLIKNGADGLRSQGGGPE